MLLNDPEQIHSFELFRKQKNTNFHKIQTKKFLPVIFVFFKQKLLALRSVKY